MSSYYGSCQKCNSDDCIDVDTGTCGNCGYNEMDDLTKQLSTAKATIDNYLTALKAIAYTQILSDPKIGHYVKPENSVNIACQALIKEL